MGWARVFMADLALEPELGGEIRLYDIDIGAAGDNEIIGNRITADSRSVGKWKYRAVGSLSDALTGADIVIISILPGTFKQMRVDVHLPERLGIYQPVGDTVGPGGIMRALRTIPHYVLFAQAIRDLSPDAWVLNYTNPMSMCLRALVHVYPQIKALGCCHEVFSTQELLATMLRHETGVKPSRIDIKVNVLGINHFTWFDSAFYQGNDLTPMFARFAEKYYEAGFPDDDYEKNAECFRYTNRVKFDLLRRYGLIAAAGDRHLAEFMPGEIYLKDKESIRNWGFSLTQVDWRVADRAGRLERTKRLVSGEEDMVLSLSGEDGIPIIKALCGLKNLVTNVNLPNDALQIANIPKEVIVETNAELSFDMVRPLGAGRLPDDIYPLFLPHIENQSLVLEAALKKDKKAVYTAFEQDPLVRGRCTKSELLALADDMMKGTLPDW